MNRLFLALATILLFSSSLAQAQFQYANGSFLTMDEVPFQPINGLTVKGVTFADTAGADYNASGGGQQLYTQDPVIEGPTGGEAITMTFFSPITSLKFGFALSTGGSVTNAVTVQLFDPLGHPLAIVSVNGVQNPGDNFDGGEFVAPNVGLIGSAVVTFSTAAGAFGLDNLAVFSPEEHQTRYAANLNLGESFINLINTGTNGASLLGPGLGAATGNICANVYAFDPAEELVSCCSCLITPDATANLGVVRDLTSNTQTGAALSSVTVKVVPTLAPAAPHGGLPGSGTSCGNSAATATVANLVSGLAAFGSTLHTTASATATTETPFTQGVLSLDELASITGRCASLIGNASGFGICASCRAGALGASKLGQ
jgi:hypothetical protein